MGFLNGDILVAVEGKPVYPVKAALERYGELNTLSTFQVLILRGGEPQLFRFSVQKEQ